MTKNFFQIITLFSILIFVLSSCSSTPEEQEPKETSIDYKQAIVGKWEYSTLNVKVNTPADEQNSEDLMVEQGEWEAKLNMQPIQVSFTEDGRYQAKYKDSEGTLLSTLMGSWAIQEDSVKMKQDKPNPGEMSLAIKVIQADQIELSGLLDWDGDKKDDDNFIAALKLANK